MLNFIVKSNQKERFGKNNCKIPQNSHKQNVKKELKKKLFLCENLWQLDSPDIISDWKIFLDFVKKSSYPFVFIGTENSIDFVEKNEKYFLKKNLESFDWRIIHYLMCCILFLESSFPNIKNLTYDYLKEFEAIKLEWNLFIKN